MARANDNLKFTGLAVVVIAAAFGVGYFVFGGQRPAAPTDTNIVPVSAPQTETKTVTQAPPPVNITPRRKNSDYTAPGAPDIRIVEERTPSLTVTHPKPTTDQADTQPSTSTDTEASQEAPPTPAASTSSSDTSSTQASDTADTNAPPATPLIPPPAPTQTSPTPATNSNSDFERIGNHTPPTSPDAVSSGKAQYRVQTGSFATSDNARALADALHSQGYTATTHAEQDNGKTVYKVQVGAYRSRAAADKAASDLQKSGYPAYTSPIGQ